MNPDTIFITRYVTSHDATVGWYEKLLGRPADARPMPSCHEWRLSDQVLFQVIEDPRRAGETSTAFRVADLDTEATRLQGIGLELLEPVPVEGFTSLRYAEARDPEGVPMGLLDGA
ncbi:MAG: VOC family protein [Propionibacteriaceae bacterium]